MTINYKTIKGMPIVAVASDPTNPIVGQVWFNSTSNVLKGHIGSPGTAAWQTGGTMNTGKSSPTGFGLQTAALSAQDASTEEYDGSAWTTVPATLNTSPRTDFDGAGTQTAGLTAGGEGGSNNILNASEEYDGSTFTNSPGTLNTSRNYGPMAGTQTAGLIFGGTGTNPALSYNATSATEKYDGSTWTSGNNMVTAESSGGGFGTQTAAVHAGGYDTSVPGSYQDATYEYDGTNWTTIPGAGYIQNANTKGGGAQTSGVIAGGYTGPTYTPGGAGVNTISHQYDGSTWTATSPINTGRYDMGCTKNTTSNSDHTIFGGSGGTTATEEWGVGAPSTVTFTDS